MLVLYPVQLISVQLILKWIGLKLQYFYHNLPDFDLLSVFAIIVPWIVPWAMTVAMWAESYI